jgi:hypothetical protein
MGAYALIAASRWGCAKISCSTLGAWPRINQASSCGLPLGLRQMHTLGRKSFALNLSCGRSMGPRKAQGAAVAVARLWGATHQIAAARWDRAKLSRSKLIGGWRVATHQASSIKPQPPDGDAPKPK